MSKKAPSPEVISPSDLACMSTPNERDRRWFLATKKGWKVHVHINAKTNDIQQPIKESYQKRLARLVVFALELGKWN